MNSPLDYDRQIAVLDAICHDSRQCFAAIAADAGQALTAPSAVYRPALFPDGTKWCALYGRDLMEGVAGFGDTPAEAMAAFDKAWAEEATPKAAQMARAIAAEEAREESEATDRHKPQPEETMTKFRVFCENKPQPEEEVFFRLRKDSDRCIVLEACNSRGKFIKNILEIEHDGTLYRLHGAETPGIQTDIEGRIKMAEDG